MAGAACVVGLMKTLAERKAKVDAIGAIGLVENMPGGNAQRPGDIVKSMSGQTIEIINTDAEGRLVLADVLHYVQDRFKPAFMIDLATLTGAIMVALGTDHAGLFSNNDELAAASGRGRARDRRESLAPAARPCLRQADRLEIRGHEEHRRPARRLDHRRAIPAALRQQGAVGASRHCRHRDGRAVQRCEPELGVGIRRAPARSARARSLRDARAVAA